MPAGLRVLVVTCVECGPIDRLPIAREPGEPEGYVLAATLVYQRLHLLTGCDVVPQVVWEDTDGYAGGNTPVVASSWAASKVGVRRT